MTLAIGSTMKTVIILVSLLSFNAIAGTCPMGDLPNEFTLHESFLSVTTTMNVEDSKGNPLGKVKLEFLSLRTIFNYTNNLGQLVAQAEKEPFSWGSNITIYDCNHLKIGAIKEDVVNNILSLTKTYTINDANGLEIAKSIKPFHLGDTHIIIGASGKDVARLDRPWLRLKDTWKVNVSNPSIIDSRILVMIGSYKTYSDRKINSNNRKSHQGILTTNY